MILFAETTSMTTFLTQVLNELREGHEGPEIPAAKRVYFQRRLRDRFFEFIRERFESEETNGLTQAKLSRRIGKSPEVINRWLNAPSNLTLDSISDLMIGIAAEEPNFSATSLIAHAQVTDEDESHDSVVVKLSRSKQEDGTSSALADARKGAQQGDSVQNQQSRSLAQDNAYSYERAAI